MAADGGYLSRRAAVDRQLNDIYCIAIEDAGFNEEYLDHHWKSNETPAEFVEWFRNKYDLDQRPGSILTAGRYGAA